MRRPLRSYMLAGAIVVLASVLLLVETATGVNPICSRCRQWRPCRCED